MPPLLDGPAPSDESVVLDVLARGELTVQARLPDASNATMLAEVEQSGVRLRCVYKPVAGEQPLWDFPDATLGHREVASYLVSAATGWRLVPPTAWRDDGPFGPGMCQFWIATVETAFLDEATDAPDGTASPGPGLPADSSAHPSHEDLAGDLADGLVDIVAPDAVPTGWRSVLRAQDAMGNPVALVHADHSDLRRMALLDVVLNNADRKGGHVLVGRDEAVRGIDHGVTFHTDPKLRTVLWGWAGERLSDAELADLRTLRIDLDAALGQQLGAHLTSDEVAATRRRLDGLIEAGTFPRPMPGHPPIPWPAF